MLSLGLYHAVPLSTSSLTVVTIQVLSLIFITIKESSLLLNNRIRMMFLFLFIIIIIIVCVCVCFCLVGIWRLVLTPAVSDRHNILSFHFTVFSFEFLAIWPLLATLHHAF